MQRIHEFVTVFFRKIIRAVLRLFPIVFAYTMKRKLVLLSDSIDSGALTILAFDPDRWTQDLLALGKVAHIRIYAVPFPVSTRIHALFFESGASPKNDSYFTEADPRILAARERQARYASRVLVYLRRWMSIECAVNPAIHYLIDFPWAKGGSRAEVPFITVHKEFTVIDDRHLPVKINRWRNLYQFKFPGEYLCVTNEKARRFFVESNVLPFEKISPTGLLRFDNLLQTPPSTPSSNPVTITFFSFGHLSGPFESKSELSGHYFTRNEDDGFVQLFNDTHAAFADAARRNPDALFLIKPKNVETWWIEKIERVVKRELGVPLSAIPNCRIVNEQAHDLIRRSTACIGLNSTVSLESIALDRDFIMPVFAEAAGKYAGNVYFPHYRDVFSVPASRAEYAGMLTRAIRGERLKKPAANRVKAMLEEYVGNSDGHAAERVAKVLFDVARNRTPVPMPLFEGLVCGHDGATA